MTAYVKRHAEETVRQLAMMFGAVLVTGSRQVGKTTLLEEVAQGVRKVTLDDKLLLTSAVERGGTFFKDYPPPVFVDEVQYAPNLFREMKIILDKSRLKGQFFLSGSQQFTMMQNVSESLAGRLGILNLLGFSLRERHGISFTDPFLPTDQYFSARRQHSVEVAYDEVWKIIHRGCLPEMVTNEDYNWERFYGAYVATYIERDVRQLTQVGDEVRFLSFMTAIASRTGQLLNIASLARDVGISQPTAERWLSILVTSNIVYLLEPYHNNIARRTVKTPKLYFLDTGLAAYLTRWITPDVLKAGAMAGAFFETFVVSEIVKSYTNQGILNLPLYFYRDKDMQEIDLVIEQAGTLYPLEIKKHADVDKTDVRTFRALDKLTDIKRGPGGVICLYENLLNLGDDNRVIPLGYI